MIDIKRPVFFSGENPCMTLCNPETKQVVSVASYWHCTDSPHGIGHVLVLWLGSDVTADPVFGQGGIFTDNLDLAKVLVNNLTQHFPEFKDVPTAALEYTDAICSHKYAEDCYHVTCRTRDIEIAIEWTGVLDRKQIVWPEFPAGPEFYDLTTVICPCRGGNIRLNGIFIDGKIDVTQSPDGQPASSAFLAFAETWIGPLAGKGVRSLFLPIRSAFNHIRIIQAKKKTPKGSLFLRPKGFVAVSIRSLPRTCSALISIRILCLVINRKKSILQ